MHAGIDDIYSSHRFADVKIEAVCHCVLHGGDSEAPRLGDPNAWRPQASNHACAQVWLSRKHGLPIVYLEPGDAELAPLLVQLLDDRDVILAEGDHIGPDLLEGNVQLTREGFVHGVSRNAEGGACRPRRLVKASVYDGGVRFCNAPTDIRFFLK